MVAPYLAILIAAPLLFALWSRRLANAAGPPEALADESRAEILHRLGQGTLAAYVVQFLAMVVATVSHREIREGTAHWMFLAYFVATVIATGAAQASCARKLRRLEGASGGSWARQLRGIIAVVALYALYRVAVTGDWLVALVPVLGRLEGAAAIAYTLARVAGGLALLALGSPLVLRFAFGSTRVTDPAILETVHRCFRRAGLEPPDVQLIESDRLGWHNAMVAGTRLGRGPFRPAIFFTASLARRFEPAEFEAVLMHEVGHLALHHVRKRMLTAVASVLAAIPVVALVIVGGSSLLPSSASPVVATTAVLALFFTEFSIIRACVRRQEIEADAFAVSMGVEREKLESALRKLTRFNDGISSKKGALSYLNPAAGHPTTDERAELLRAPRGEGRLGRFLLVAAVFGGLVVILASGRLQKRDLIAASRAKVNASRVPAGAGK